MKKSNRIVYKLFRMSTVGQRVRQARDEADLSQTALADLIGVKQATISELENGESQGSKHIVAIATVTGVRPEWLADEKGPMRAAVTPHQAEFARLPAETQSRLLAVAKALENS